MIPSKPMIPRRNSANRYNEDDQFLKNLNNDSYDTEFKNYFAGSNEYNPIHKKYETMPNMRNVSAKNSKFMVGLEAPMPILTIHTRSPKAKPTI